MKLTDLKKVNGFLDICCNVRYACISTRTICDNADRIVLSQELKCLCSKTTTVVLELTVPKIMDVSYIFIVLD